MKTPARRIGTIGTASRLVAGVGLLAAAVFAGTDGGLQWYELVLGLLAPSAILLGWQLLRVRSNAPVLNATGTLAFALNFAIAATFFTIEATRDAALVFFGVSMLLAAVRGYAGCEVLAISNWILRRDDQVGCVVFSPLDAIEARVAGGTGSSG